jgi:hypothetical protein
MQWQNLGHLSMAMSILPRYLEISLVFRRFKTELFEDVSNYVLPESASCRMPLQSFEHRNDVGARVERETVILVPSHISIVDGKVTLFSGRWSLLIGINGVSSNDKEHAQLLRSPSQGANFLEHHQGREDDIFGNCRF